ncbi:transcriptional regulator [Homoserinimonas sp. OAct 916]|uniref:ArsR/SmtB family transcription factor n=1 Tax=Homoserinimonas sp. OAct 916 TaxID=2211450 RepID=UPI000DBE114C|nr:helix-turn-helix domain-containing protein [Homoserinimonas sp. OAct 916]
MPEKSTGRLIDSAALKALAHPLRVEILDELSLYGPATASGLAERLGESSGATSYHLRQLAKHAFVREVEGRGTGRERWWERTPGGLTLDFREYEDSPAAVAASEMVSRQWQQRREAILVDFMDHGLERLSEDWIAASVLNSATLTLTSGQLAEISQAWIAFLDENVAKYRGVNLPGSRPVQLQFNAFPLVAGKETPS